MKIWSRSILTVALTLTVLGALTLLGASRAQGSGCSRAEGHQPVVGGCAARAGSVCYYCEYPSSGGGYSICGENVSGSVSLCIDFQDLPPLPNF